MVVKLVAGLCRLLLTLLAACNSNCSPNCEEEQFRPAGVCWLCLLAYTCNKVKMVFFMQENLGVACARPYGHGLSTKSGRGFCKKTKKHMGVA